MEDLWTRVGIWGGWTAFFLIGSAYIRLFRSAGAGNLRRMEAVLAEGVRQMAEDAERIDELSEANRLLHLANDKLEVYNAEIQRHLHDRVADNQALQRALELSRLGNERLLNDLEHQTDALKRAQQDIENLKTEVIKLNAQYGDL